jgi:serine/threonine protein phosphatase PrpC
VQFDAQVWGPLLTGAAVLSLAWLVLGKKQPPPEAPAERDNRAPTSDSPAPTAQAAGAPRPHHKRKRKRAADLPKDQRPLPKAIVWEAPKGELADEDITVLHALPMLERTGAEISFSEAPDSEPGETDEDRQSRVELHYEEDAEVEEVTEASARILLYAAGESDRGRVRQRNEDSMLVMPERSLFAIADGMGGHRGGEVASSIAIDALEDAFARNAFEGRVHADIEVPRRARELAAAVHMTNECVRSMALADRELSDMGTTLVAARFSPNKQRLYLGHVGDSRCYRLRGGKFRQLTTDHTMAALGMTGPRSNDLFQAIGTSPGVMIDLIVDKPQDDDIYLLCSDGLSKMLTDERVCELLLEHADLETAMHALIEEANARGGRDNVSVIVIKVLSRKRCIDAITREAAS